MQCSSCSSRDIEFNESAGHAVCVQCGTVLEENTIVSSIEFQESGDRSQIVGQFVSGNCSQSSYGAGPRGRGRYGFSRDSRDATLSNARRVISQVISTLRLPTHYIDKANRLYSLALQRNFLFGRRQIHVVAAVTYTVARQEGSPHLLIDFSDVLQVNVYVIGQCFLQLIRLLSLRLPIVDPSLFIHRFAARMDLGSSSGPVALTAMRTIARMKKDWINTGRRPDGVCAAAVLVASRAHGFDRTLMEVAQTFRMSAQTISKRLQDFRLTPSAQLTVEQFQLHDILAEFDPPSFIRNQLESGLSAQADREGGPEDEEEEAFLGGEEDTYSLVAPAAPMSMQLHVDSTGGQLEEGATSSYAEGGSADLQVKFMPIHQSALRDAQLAKNESRQRLYADIYAELGAADATAGLASEAEEVARSVLVGAGRNVPFVLSIPTREGGAAPSRPVCQAGTLRKRVSRIRDTSSRVTHLTAEDAVEAEADSAAQEGAMDGIDDEEIRSFILSEDEQKKRSAIWERMHRGYIDERESRRVQKEKESGKRSKRDATAQDGAGAGGPGAVSGTGAQHGHKRARTHSGAAVGAGADAQLAGGDALAQPQPSVAFIKKSKKVNFSALQSVMNLDDGQFIPPSKVRGVDTEPSRGAPIAATPSRSAAAAVGAVPSVVTVSRRARPRHGAPEPDGQTYQL